LPFALRSSWLHRPDISMYRMAPPGSACRPAILGRDSEAPMRALLSLVPLMALPFLAASCDGGSRTADAATLAVTTAAQESSTDSVRFTMELRSIGGDDETVVAPAEGQLDFAAGVGEMIIPQREGEEPIHYIWHDGKTYQSWFDT